MRLRIGVALAAASLVLACGGDEPSSMGATKSVAGEEQASPQASRPARPNTAPEIIGVELVPDPPVPGRRVRAVVEGEDADGDNVHYEFVWRLDGRDLRQNTSEILVNAPKDALLEVTVTPRDGRSAGEPMEATANVGNSPPRMLNVVIEAPEQIFVGRDVVVTPEAEDPDDDPVTFVYHWTVNGEERENDSPKLSTESLAKGDAIQVTVTADDGDDQSEPMASNPVEVLNSVPTIVSEPQWTVEDGVFRYTVEAEDVDGDTSFRYRLDKAPDGMTIDPVLGTVEWAPRPNQRGEHTVEVSVDDQNGGVAGQAFTVVVDLDEAPPRSEVAPASFEDEFYDEPEAASEPEAAFEDDSGYE